MNSTKCHNNLGEYDPAKRHHQYTPNYNKYNQNTRECNIS